MTKYFLYARKLTESEDRPVLSIEAQITELREFAKKENLSIIAEFTESMSAKEPSRPVFNELLARFEKEKQTEFSLGILTDLQEILFMVDGLFILLILVKLRT